MKLLRASVLLLALQILTLEVCAQATDEARNSMRGAKSMMVVVELSPQLEQLGMTDLALRHEIELGLRESGILIVTEEESQFEQGAPYLLISLTGGLTQETPGGHSGSFTFMAHMGFFQIVSLIRDPGTLTYGQTWKSSFVGYGHSESAVPLMREAVLNLEDAFLRDYLSVNPRLVAGSEN